MYSVRGAAGSIRNAHRTPRRGSIFFLFTLVYLFAEEFENKQLFFSSLACDSDRVMQCIFANSGVVKLFFFS